MKWPCRSRLEGECKLFVADSVSPNHSINHKIRNRMVGDCMYVLINVVAWGQGREADGKTEGQAENSQPLHNPSP